MKKKHSPQTAKTFEQVCKLRSDNRDAGDFWILTDGPTVTICAQKPGESATGEVTIPKAVFNRLVRWYLLPQ